MHLQSELWACLSALFYNFIFCFVMFVIRTILNINTVTMILNNRSLKKKYIFARNSSIKFNPYFSEGIIIPEYPLIFISLA